MRNILFGLGLVCAICVIGVSANPGPESWESWFETQFTTGTFTSTQAVNGNNAKALNWDNEKTYDVQVVFCKNGIEATIYFSDGWHEPRTLTLLYPSKPKDPKKIEMVDIERDVFWDIEVEE